MIESRMPNEYPLWPPPPPMGWWANAIVTVTQTHTAANSRIMVVLEK